MFIASCAISTQAPEELNLRSVAPPELEIIPCHFYKHYAPPELRDNRLIYAFASGSLVKEPLALPLAVLIRRASRNFGYRLLNHVARNDVCSGRKLRFP